MKIHLAVNNKDHKAVPTLQSSNSTSGNLLQGNKEEKSHLCKDVHSSPIHKKGKLETIPIATTGEMAGQIMTLLQWNTL